MAIRIRNVEIGSNVMGAVGSSPLVTHLYKLRLTLIVNLARTVVIIFAPLTLVHVMVSIYV